MGVTPSCYQVAWGGGGCEWPFGVGAFAVSKKLIEVFSPFGRERMQS